MTPTDPTGVAARAAGRGSDKKAEAQPAHTWEARDRGIGWEVHGPDDLPINDEFRETFTEANARLIAAAPELLEAAKIGAEWIGFWLSESDCECEFGHTCGKNERERELRKIQSAIAKATGKEAE